MLDFNVKGDGNFNSGATEFYLKDLFGDVVARDRFVGSVLKTTVFVIESGKNVINRIS